LEGDHIPFLESHGQALEQECCFPVVFRHCDDLPAYLLYQLYGRVMPCTGCLNDSRVENMSYYYYFFFEKFSKS